ncbi:MAG: hypothetical protein JRH11_17900 [Deltaproteobacteria bacterium]|nr:hypothetical protein [Deltaproteobacteria bacterium]
MGIFGDNEGQGPSIRALEKSARQSADPREAASHYCAAAEQASKAGKLKKAIALFQQAIEKAPEDERAAIGLEAALVARGDDQSLRSELTRRLSVLTRLRRDARAVAFAHARLAQTEEQMGQIDAALVNFRRAYELDPSHSDFARDARRLALDHKRWSVALDVLETEVAVETNHAHRATLLALMAQISCDQFLRFDDAVDLYERAIRSNPGNVSTRRALVDTLLKRAERSKDQDSRDRDRYSAADILCDLVHAVPASEQAAFIIEALDVAPEHAPALNLLEKLAPGDMKQLLSRWEEHVLAFPDGPTSDEVRWRLAREHIATGRPGHGLRWIEELGAGGDVDAMVQAVELHDVAGRREEARRWAGAAIDETAPEGHIEMHRRLFVILSSEDELGAEPHARALLSENPGDRATFRVVRNVLRDQGEKHELAALYQRGAAASGELRAEILPDLAALLEQLGQAEEALACFREIEQTTSGPGAGDARVARVRLAELTGSWDELAELLEADLHSGLRGDPTRATDALLSLLSIVPEDHTQRVLDDLETTLENAGAESAALGKTRQYADNAAPGQRVAIFRRLARIYTAFRNGEGAEDAWNFVRLAAPDDVEALAHSIEIALGQERYRAAIDYLEHWANLLPPDEAIAKHRRIAQIAEEHLRDRDRAADALAAALDVRPSDRPIALELAAALRQAGRHGEEKVVLKVLMASAEDAATRRGHQTRLARIEAGALRDPEEAVRVWTQLVNDTIEIGPLLIMRDDARSEGDQGRLDVILARLASLESDEAARSEHTLERAHVLTEELGRPELARRVLSHAMTSHAASHLATHEYLERLAVEASDHRSLAQALEGLVVLRNEQGRVDLLRRLSELYTGALEDHRGAVRALLRWEDLVPTDSAPLVALLPLFARAGDWAGLLARVDRLIALSQDNAQNWVDLAATAVFESPAGDEDSAGRHRARAWLLIELAERAQAPAQRVRLVENAAASFESAGDYDEAFTATARAIAFGGARVSLLERAERTSSLAAAPAKLDGLYAALIKGAATDDDRVALAIRHSDLLTAANREGDAVDRLLRIGATMPMNQTLLDTIDEHAANTGRMDDALAAYVDRATSLGGERAVQVLCRGARVASEASNGAAMKHMLAEAIQHAGDDDALLDSIEVESVAIGPDASEEVVRLFEAVGRAPQAPRDRAATFLVRAARMMKTTVGLEDVAFGVLKTALALSPTTERVLDAIEESAVERELLPYLEHELKKMIDDSTDRAECAALLMRRGKILEQHLDDADGARECYLSALPLAPDDVVVLRSLRMNLLTAGKVQDLVSLLERRLDRIPEDDADARGPRLRELARLWEEEAKNPEEALETWKRLLVLRPDDSGAQQAIKRLEGTSP